MFIKSVWPLLSLEDVTNASEICVLLAYCEEYSFQSLPTFQNNRAVPTSRVKIS